MKIKKLVVKNYKVFDHLELDFTDKNGDVLDTIVFAGLNGSGKTTILELLADLLNGNTPTSFKDNTEILLEILIFGNYLEDIKDRDNGFLSLKTYSKKSKILIFNTKYHQENHDKSYSVDKVATLGNVIAEDIGGYFDETDNRSVDEIIYFHPHGNKAKTWEKSKNVGELTLETDGKNILKEILENIHIEVFGNIDTPPRQTYSKIVNDLNKVFNQLNVQSKLLEVDNHQLIFESVNHQKIRFDDLSRGEKILYFMGFSLYQRKLKYSLILVDEPEDSLHPTWQQQIIRFFQNIGSNNQVILATHSPQIIASVRPESLFVLAIDNETRRVTAHNMADEHKHTHGVEPNRILSEIMGTPLRDYETQQRINTILGLIKHVEFNPSVSGVVQVEKEINSLAEDLGKQDASIMRFRNEILLLKRKTLIPQ